MRTLLLDNDDSFTWNLWQQISALGVECEVMNHRSTSLAKIKKWNPDCIVISPGPGHPKDAKLANDLLRSFFKSQTLSPTPIPTLGICLGHQCIGSVFGDSSCVVHASRVMHGKTSKIFHDGTSIMKGVPSPFHAARYHSLILKEVPQDFELLCWTGSQKKPDLIMGIRHTKLPIVGLQFHPESFLTEHGDLIMRNFLFGS